MILKSLCFIYFLSGTPVWAGGYRFKDYNWDQILITSIVGQLQSGVPLYTFFDTFFGILGSLPQNQELYLIKSILGQIDPSSNPEAVSILEAMEEALELNIPLASFEGNLLGELQKGGKTGFMKIFLQIIGLVPIFTKFGLPGGAIENIVQLGFLDPNLLKDLSYHLQTTSPDIREEVVPMLATMGQLSSKDKVTFVEALNSSMKYATNADDFISRLLEFLPGAFRQRNSFLAKMIPGFLDASGSVQTVNGRISDPTGKEQPSVEQLLEEFTPILTQLTSGHLSPPDFMTKYLDFTGKVPDSLTNDFTISLQNSIDPENYPQLAKVLQLIMEALKVGLPPTSFEDEIGNALKSGDYNGLQQVVSKMIKSAALFKDFGLPQDAIGRIAQSGNQNPEQIEKLANELKKASPETRMVATKMLSGVGKSNPEDQENIFNGFVDALKRTASGGDFLGLLKDNLGDIFPAFLAGGDGIGGIAGKVMNVAGEGLRQIGSLGNIATGALGDIAGEGISGPFGDLDGGVGADGGSGIVEDLEVGVPGVLRSAGDLVRGGIDAATNGIAHLVGGGGPSGHIGGRTQNAAGNGGLGAIGDAAEGTVDAAEGAVDNTVRSFGE